MNLKNLSGAWHLRVDEAATGQEEQWYEQAFSNDKEKAFFQLPGSSADNEVGKPYIEETTYSQESVRCLRKRYDYIGCLWLQKEVTIEDWTPGSVYELTLERVMWQSNLWINGQLVGRGESLSTAHIYRISDQITGNGTYQFTLMIDNRDHYEINNTPSAYTEETQTIWNGVIGAIELQKIDPLLLDRFQLITNPQEGTIDTAITLSPVGEAASYHLVIEVIDPIGEILSQEIHIDQVEELEAIETSIKVMNPKAWDEFTPNLYQVRLSVQVEGVLVTLAERQVGFVDFKATEGTFHVNGHPVFLRGEVECCVFPKTGYPEMDRPAWDTIMQQLKAYGLNHLRCHSWCPPEAAFASADAHGIYVQVEGPMWLDDWMGVKVGDKPGHYDYFPQELEKIVKAYGHHPSFVMMACGNELRGDFGLLHDMVQHLKAINPTIHYTLSSNWDRPMDSVDDYFISQSVDQVPIRGQFFLDRMVEGTDLKFDEGIALRSMPTISHEVGQYCVYPDMKEIDQYDGSLMPANFMAIKRDLVSKNMLGEASKFTLASGKLAYQLYKREIECAMLTQNMAGIQLLGLHDFPGQATATIGLLNSFWESKGIIEPQDFRECCQEVVPLVAMEQLIYEKSDSFVGELSIANFYRPMQDQVINWSFNIKEEVLAKGQFVQNVATGLDYIGKIELENFEGITGNQQIELVVEMVGTPYKNRWQLWVYDTVKASNQPDPVAQDDQEASILMATTWSQEVEATLEAGGKVLLLPDSKQVKAPYPVKFFPVFWSPVWFLSQDPCGIICEGDHEIFTSFPTDNFSSFQWKDILEGAYSLPYEAIEGLKPLVQIVPNFYCNALLTALFEAQVGKGHLVVCTLPIMEEGLCQSALKQSILEYMATSHPQDLSVLKVDDIKGLFKEEGLQEINPFEGLVEVAHQGRASSDRDKSKGFAAAKALDGNVTTAWSAAEAESGHWWQVDLREVRAVEGIRLHLVHAIGHEFIIESSEDGESYQEIYHCQDLSLTHKVRHIEVSCQARYIRVTYSRCSQSVAVAHHSVEVYSRP